MLQTIREKITGWVAGIVIAVIGIVFVFWGADFQSSAGGYAAKVNGTSIPLQTVRNAWQQRQTELQQMLSGDLPADLVRSQQQMVLERFIQETLLTQRAREQGYRVSDEVLAQRVMDIPQFQVDGQFSQDRYIALLRSNGLSEAAFEADLQSGLMMEQLQQGVMDSAFVTAGELNRRYQLEQQQRELNYVLLPTSAFLAGVEISDEQIEAFYQSHAEEYLSQEMVDLQYIELTRAQAEGNIQVTEDGLRDYFERIKDRFVTEERRHGRHILITTGDGVDEAAAEKKAQELTEQARSGADFAQLATENSQDPGSAAEGGDLGWAQRGMFVGPFEDALFSMEVGEIRGPVKTDFGYHVLKLEAVESGHAPDFEQSRAQVEAEYRAEQAQTIFYDQSQDLADRAFNALTDLQPVADELGLELKTINDFTREGGGEFAGEREVIEAAFSPDVLERRQNSPLVAVGDDKALVLRVVDHRPAEPLPLAQVRGQIETRMRLQAARDAAQARGEEIIARLKAGEDWEAVKGDGVEPVGSRFVTRQDGIAPAAVLRTAFGVDQSTLGDGKVHVAGVNTDDGNYAVLTVSEVRNGDPSAEEQQQLQARQRRAEMEAGGGEFNAYVAEAMRTAKVVRNSSVFE